MDSIEKLINRHLDKFIHFDYYFFFVQEIEHYHKDIQTGSVIDCCNALLQSISKTIILHLDPKIERQSLNKSSTQKLVKQATKLLQKNDDTYESDFTSRISGLSDAISLLRNARGDISHGKAIPKELIDDQDLSRLMKEITESLSRYLLSSFFAHELDKEEKQIEELELEIDDQLIDYEANPEFNDYLDEQYVYEGKLLYSQGLYTLYYEDYIIQLEEFLSEQPSMEAEEE